MILINRGKTECIMICNKEAAKLARTSYIPMATQCHAEKFQPTSIITKKRTPETFETEELGFFSG